jgi:membrane protein
VRPRGLPGLTADQRREVVESGTALWRGFQGTLGGRFLEAFVELRAIDRSLALASKLFIAILPLSILITAVLSGNSFGDELVARFGLTGSGAHAARALFAAPTQVQAGIGVLGLVILVSSILSFARALERAYLDCWEMPAATSGAGRDRLLWLAGCIVTVSLSSTANEAVENAGARALGWLVALFVGGVFFLWTPYLLLGRRVPARRLLPTGILTGAALLVFAIGSDVIMPELVSHNTIRYGLIGFTFSLVTWLFCGAVLVVAGAILGALLDRRIVRSG